jgi:type I site-specific restriction endonuclease
VQYVSGAAIQGFDAAKPWKGEPPDVVYNAGIPPEFFDFVIVDECHRSIYELWAQVLLYFDSFLVGLTATPAGKTIGFFNQNLVMQYGHDEAVTDGVNVDFDVYRIRTRITQGGATIVADPTGVYVDRRHKLTRAERLEKLTQDLTYTANELDRDVVSESQIRTVVRQFRDKVLPDAFPGRTEVPKTLIFAKDDSHADDIVRMARDEFAEKNEFCEKITYRTGFTRVVKKVKNDDGTESEVTEWVKTSSLSPDEILSNFRNSYFPRIAVTVDMISTGTDVKPIECVFFLRNVKSAGFFEQMKGRGVRIISPDKLRVVTPSAKAKERFIIVDAVGVRADCDRASRETERHYRKRRVTPFVQELRYRRSSSAWELLAVAEECLRQLRQARALSIAEWRPGDQIIVQTVVKGFDPDLRRYVVTDVDWSKPDSYHYDVWQLTKARRFYERGGQTWVYPSDRIYITRCKDALSEEMQRKCASYRSSAEQFLEDVRDRGDIDHIVKSVQERRARGLFY